MSYEVASTIGAGHFGFVDLGYGVGKTLLMASGFPFRRVIGVELGGGLTAVARDNIATYDSDNQRCHDISAVHANALDYPLPPGPVVLFFFNPFGDELMGRMVDRVRRSQQRIARPLYVIYYNPQHREHFFQRPGFELADSGLGLQGRYMICRWVPEAADDAAASADTAAAGAGQRETVAA